jgi:hypothetical protein
MEKLVDLVHEMVDRMGLCPWWTVATDGDFKSRLYTEDF